MLFRVRVSGESCWPALVPGKTYWASTFRKIRKGDFVVFRNPIDRKEIFVKKIFRVQEKGYKVVSLISWGESSKDFGIVSKKNVLGKVICSKI
ncbi:MAG: hypothetical protein HY007_03060 [Candidatus Sungbacteria bacterium]|nr:hypothetical protein [Candidatus Sungbacteria bacterium]